MTNRKAIRRARRIRRTVLTVCLMALVAVLSIGGTIAYLISTPESITNTFVVGDVTINLTETLPEDNDSIPMIPGAKIDKNPTVVVEAKSEACYVYVKVDKTNNPDTYLTYTIDSAWKPLTGVEGVYYIEVADATAEAGASYPVLADSKVEVKGTVDEETLEAAEKAQPALTFTAYAIQMDNTGTAAEAWAKLNTQLAD